MEERQEVTRPIKLHQQHNIEFRLLKESQQLAFIKANKGPPPYKFEPLLTEYEQVFRPNGSFGVVRIPEFCLIVNAIQRIKDFLFQYSYVMTVFFKEVNTSNGHKKSSNSY